MRVLGIDVETTGLDATKDRIIEVGACLFDWETATPLALYSSLVAPGIPISPEITTLTGITDEQVEEFGRSECSVITDVELLANRADYLMAHNAEFDRGFYEAAIERQGWERNSPDMQRNWLCSRYDIVYPESITTRQLNYLAAESGFINPWKHRALFDVMTMLRLASAYRLEEIIKRSQEPTVYVRALVSFDDKEKAKLRGYIWCAPQKIWWRSFKESDYLAEKDACGFATLLLEKSPE